MPTEAQRGAGINLCEAQQKLWRIQAYALRALKDEALALRTDGVESGHTIDMVCRLANCIAKAEAELGAAKHRYRAVS